MHPLTQLQGVFVLNYIHTKSHIVVVLYTCTVVLLWSIVSYFNIPFQIHSLDARQSVRGRSKSFALLLKERKLKKKKEKLPKRTDSQLPTASTSSILLVILVLCVLHVST